MKKGKKKKTVKVNYTVIIKDKRKNLAKYEKIIIFLI